MIFENRQCFHMSEHIETAIYGALIGEVYTTPKPGLVDLHDTGAHKDMDAKTFEISTQAIGPFLVKMAGEGYWWNQNPENLFLKIRCMGIEAEKKMFEATQGVNTHKGMIFTMGILSAAAGYQYRKDHHFSVLEILDIAQKMTERILERDFRRMEHKIPETNGEKLYHLYREKGIRGEAQQGFPIIRHTAYPAMRKYQALGLEQNQVNINVLLEIIAKLSDTNVITRGSHRELKWIQEEAVCILEEGGILKEEDYEKIACMNERCIEKNVSPGGAADILAATLFLFQLEEKQNEQNN